MTGIDYGIARMNMQDRVHAAETRRLIREAKQRERAARPASDRIDRSSHRLSRIALAAAFWRHAPRPLAQPRAVASS